MFYLELSKKTNTTLVYFFLTISINSLVVSTCGMLSLDRFFHMIFHDHQAISIEVIPFPMELLGLNSTLIC